MCDPLTMFIFGAGIGSFVTMVFAAFVIEWLESDDSDNL